MFSVDGKSISNGFQRNDDQYIISFNNNAKGIYFLSLNTLKGNMVFKVFNY